MKVGLIGDLHFGEHRDSIQFNEKLIDYIQFVINKAQEENVSNLVVLGDVFHKRDQISNLTLNYAYKGIKQLSDYFENIFVVIGNHDMYYKNSREINSLEIFKEFNNIHINSNSICWKHHNMLFVNWICDEEDWNQLLNYSDKDQIDYIFGHFEFNGFKLNDVSLCETGYNPSTLFKCFPRLQKIFTGHFHSPQNKAGVEYIGSPFPHNFSDTSLNHGFKIIDVSTNDENNIPYDKVQYHILSYKDYQNGKLEQLNDSEKEIYVRLDINEQLTNDQIDSIRKNLEEKEHIENFNIQYIPDEQKEILESEIELEQIQDIDQQVIQYLSEIDLSEYQDYDNNQLIRFYNEVKEGEE